MPDYSLVPVDHQPDFYDASLVPVDHDPFSDEGTIRQAQAQPVQSQPLQPQPASPPQPQAIGADQPGIGAPFTGGPGGSSGGASHGNAASDTNNPTSGQSRSPVPVLFPGFADLTPMTDRAPISSGDRGADDVRQKIVDLASGQIGSEAWDANVAKGNFGAGSDKCNLFVYEMLTGAGASPGTPNGWRHPSGPTAGQWADQSYAIPGWRVLGLNELPQPGDVVGQRIQWSNGATGHVMIVGPNGTFVGIGPPERRGDPERIVSVPSKMMGLDRPGGLLVYRRYEP